MNVGLLTSVSAIALVGYVAAVTYHGNALPLANALKEDWQYLEWLAAAGILYVLVRETNMSTPVSLLIGVAVVSVLLKRAGPLAGAASDLASGKTGLFEALAEFAGVKK